MFVITCQFMFLTMMALVDVVKREVDNIPIAFLFLTGVTVSIIEGPQWNWWNFAPTVLALFAYGFYQIGGADAKVLIALTPMPGPWIPWFLVTAFILQRTLWRKPKSCKNPSFNETPRNTGDVAMTTKQPRSSNRYCGSKHTHDQHFHAHGPYWCPGKVHK